MDNNSSGLRFKEHTLLIGVGFYSVKLSMGICRNQFEQIIMGSLKYLLVA